MYIQNLQKRKIMVRYIQFTDRDGDTFLVEINEVEIQSKGGIEKAGLKEMIGKVIVEAQTTFEQATENVVQQNVKAFRHAVRQLAEQDQPETMEITFGLKATGEVGNVAIARGVGEANYTITLTWKRETKDKK